MNTDRTIILGSYRDVDPGVMRKMASIRGSRDPDPSGPLVYVLRVVIGNQTLVKVGFTARRLSDRIKSIQTSCPAPIDVVGWFRASRAVEQQIHAMMDGVRRSGEWFALVDPDDDCLDDDRRHFGTVLDGLILLGAVPDFADVEELGWESAGALDAVLIDLWQQKEAVLDAFSASEAT